MQVPLNSIIVADPLDALKRMDPQQFNLTILDPPYYGSYLFDLNDPKSPPYKNYHEFLKYIVAILLQAYRVLNQNGALLFINNPLSPLNPRLFLDRIFGKQNFRAEIIIESPIIVRGLKSPYINFENVFFYSKSDDFTYNVLVKELSEKEIKSQYRHKDSNGFYKLWNLVDNIERPDKYFSWNGVLPPKGNSWKYSRQRLDDMYEKGEIVSVGKSFRRKVYFSEDQSHKPLGFVWSYEVNLEKDQIDQRFVRLIEMASQQNDLILDPFTTPATIAAFLKTDRNCVGISQFEISEKQNTNIKSNYFVQLNKNDIETEILVDNSEIPLNLQRFIDLEAGLVSPQSIVEKGQKYAYLVGINHYHDGIPELRYCKNDVVKLGEILKGLGYQVKIIHDEMEDNNLIPLRSNIETELNNWTQCLTAEDTLYVHFSGHGALQDNEAMIITGDTRAERIKTTALRISEVINIMKNGRAKKLVLSLDICQGGIEMGRALFDSDFFRNVYENAEGFVLLAASTAQQFAYDYDEHEHGVFSYFLIKGLGGEADLDGDGRITVTELKNYILDQIRQWSLRYGHRQEPTYRAEGIGEITLVNPGKNE